MTTPDPLVTLSAEIHELGRLIDNDGWQNLKHGRLKSAFDALDQIERERKLEPVTEEFIKKFCDMLSTRWKGITIGDAQAIAGTLRSLGADPDMIPRPTREQVLAAIAKYRVIFATEDGRGETGIDEDDLPAFLRALNIEPEGGEA